MILVCNTCSDDDLDRVEQNDGEAPLVGMCSRCGGPWPKEIESALMFAELREANVARCEQAFHPVDDWSVGDWCNAVAGEVGEIAGVLKEARRKDPHYTLTPALRRMLADEIADAVIYTDLLCARIGHPLSVPLSSEPEEQIRIGRKTSFYETFAGLDIASNAWVADQAGLPWSSQEYPRSTSGATRSAQVARAMGRLAVRVMALGDGEAIVSRVVEQGGSYANSASFIQNLTTCVADAARDLVLELGRLAAVFRIDTGRAVRDKFNEVSVKRCGCPIFLGDTGVVSVSD